MRVRVRAHTCVCVCVHVACVAGNSIQSVFLHLSVFSPFFFLSLFPFPFYAGFKPAPAGPMTPLCANMQQSVSFWIFLRNECGYNNA